MLVSVFCVVFMKVGRLGVYFRFSQREREVIVGLLILSRSVKVSLSSDYTVALLFVS